MANYRNIGDAPGLSGPPDPEPSIFDDLCTVEEILSDNGLPDYLCTAFAEIASRGWVVEAWGDQMAYIERHIQPILDKAEKDAREARRKGPDCDD